MIKVLIAEDNVDNAELLTEFLDDEGYAVSVASNAADTIRIATEQLPDVILMDMQMPRDATAQIADNEQGLLAISAIRNAASTRKIPIVAVTGFDSESFKQTAIDAGCYTVAKKPYDFDALLNVIQEVTE